MKKRLYGYRKWESESPRIKSTASIGSVIFQLFERMGMSEKIIEQEAVTKWPEVVGSEISSISEAKSIKRGVLRVSIRDSSWRNELAYMKEEILQKLNFEIGKTVVSDIKFS